MSTTTVERPHSADPGSGLGGDWRVLQHAVLFFLAARDAGFLRRRIA
jgi:hypothetical protein